MLKNQKTERCIKLLNEVKVKSLKIDYELKTEIMKTGLLKLFVAAFLLITVSASAQPGRGLNNGPQERPRFEKMNAFNAPWMQSLTEEQKATIQEIRLNGYKQCKPLRDELRELMAHQRTLTTADNPDMKAINANIDKMSDVKNQLAKAMTKQRVDIRAQLTEEQKMQFDKMKMHTGFGKGGKRGGNGPGNGPGFGPGSGTCPRL